MKKKHRIDHRFKTEYEKWCLLPDLTEEERKLLVSMTEEEQQECFYRQVPFGTAGMRGKVGLGSNRINRYTIRLAAWGMAKSCYCLRYEIGFKKLCRGSGQGFGGSWS